LISATKDDSLDLFLDVVKKEECVRVQSSPVLNEGYSPMGDSLLTSLLERLNEFISPIGGTISFRYLSQNFDDSAFMHLVAKFSGFNDEELKAMFLNKSHL
jgi:hypothetical protein